MIRNIIAALVVAVASATATMPVRAAAPVPTAPKTETWWVIVEGPKGAAAVRCNSQSEAIKAAAEYRRAGLIVHGIVRGNVL